MKLTIIITLIITTFIFLTVARVNNFRSKNADEAEKLTKDFKKLSINSNCKYNEQACINDQFAQCVNRKFQLFPCNSGLICVVLPLVNKPGTSITCGTESDRKMRVDDARND